MNIIAARWWLCSHFQSIYQYNQLNSYCACDVWCWWMHRTLLPRAYTFFIYATLFSAHCQGYSIFFSFAFSSSSAHREQSIGNCFILTLCFFLFLMEVQFHWIIRYFDRCEAGFYDMSCAIRKRKRRFSICRFCTFYSFFFFLKVDFHFYFLFSILYLFKYNTLLMVFFAL